MMAKTVVQRRDIPYSQKFNRAPANHRFKATENAERADRGKVTTKKCAKQRIKVILLSYEASYAQAVESYLRGKVTDVADCNGQ